MSEARLGTFLVDNKLLRPEEWGLRVTEAKTARKSVLAHLVSMGDVSISEANRAFAYSQGWGYVSLATDEPIDDALITLLPDPFARQHKTVPVSRTDSSLTVAVSNPSDLNIAKVLRGQTGLSITLVYSPQSELDVAVDRYYSTSAESARKGAIAAQAIEATGAGRLQGIGQLGDYGEIVDALNIIIEGALKAGASDIHLEPGRDHLSIRYSIDGKPRGEPLQSSAIAPRLAALIKTRAHLASSELTNQDGVISHTYNGVSYDLRVAVLPSVWGESITLRLGADSVRNLSEIGFAPDNEERWRRSLDQPNGINLAVGPMGSGKTTLHYSSLDVLMGQGRKIISLEAPVEMKFADRITQVSINPKQGLTWDGTMETVLRSAASVLFVGEINKEEVAHTAISAAITGHLVLSTLHTNDAPGAVVRLREMGVRPSVLADAMRAVCAQRLPRVLCTCKVAEKPSQELIRDFKLTNEDLAANEWFGPSEHGCGRCMGLSYKGRAPIHELMTFPYEIRDLITEDAPNRVIADTAKTMGMRTLAQDGLMRVREGVTGLRELRTHILID